MLNIVSGLVVFMSNWANVLTMLFVFLMDILAEFFNPTNPP